MSAKRNRIGRLVVTFAFVAAMPLLSPVFGAESAGQQSAITSDTASPSQLVGRWVRADGGYVIDVRSATFDGKLDAGYFNPRPIKVGRAEWVSKEGKLFVYIELRDVNYPGSNYTLQYAADGKRMVGNYFQAVQKANFNVEFVRQEQPGGNH